MAYSVVTDVESEYKDVDFSAAASAVQTSEITGFIAQADAFIDSYISNRYEVPVTGTASLLILKTISIWLVKYRINSILSVKSPVVDKVTQSPDGPSLRKQAIDMLEMISAGQLDLLDATLLAGDGAMTSFLMNKDLTYTNQVDVDNW